MVGTGGHGRGYSHIGCALTAWDCGSGINDSSLLVGSQR